MSAQIKPFKLVVCLLLSGCGAETVVHNLEEKEANQIIELLSEADISGSKGINDTGRSVVYTVSVPSKNRIEAIKLLNRFEMPRRRDMGYNEIFKDSGLIPTAGEEKAKQLASLEGEIEKQLKLVDGILDVQVQLVLPEESAMRTNQDVRSPTTASVTIKYMPSAGGSKPLSEPQVQAVVAAGVERLTPDNVVVIMTPGGPVMRSDKPEAEHDSGVRGVSKAMRVAMVVVLGVVVGVSLLAFILFVQLRTVRNRLTRLQGEIAKARRKPGMEGTPPGG